MSDNPEALPQPKQHAPIYPDESRADQYAASRYVSGWNDCHAAFTAALAQQAATPPLKPQDGDDDDLRLALELIDKIKTAETNGDLLADVMRYRYTLRERCIAAAARQAATPAPAGWKLVPVDITPEMAKAACWRYTAEMAKDWKAAVNAAPSATPAAQPADERGSDIADIVAGALQTSRAHAYELMRDALEGR